jgi:L-threonylcarbamoyladenylate synthase
MNKLSLNEAAGRLAEGQVGIIATDTLLGIVCQAKNKTAVTRLYGAKSRENKPGTLIAADIDQLVDIGIKRRYLTAVAHYWPNPISIVLPCTDAELEYLHQGKQSLAVRIPALETLRQLLYATGPLLTSSANMPGMPPARTFEEAEQYFKDAVDFYAQPIDGSTNQPSTVIRILDDAVAVLRQGSVKIDPATGAILN